MPSEISRTVEYQNLEYESILQVPWNFGFSNIKPFSWENQVLEHRPIRLVPWNFGFLNTTRFSLCRGKSGSRIQIDSSSTVEFRDKNAEWNCSHGGKDNFLERHNLTDRALVYGTPLFAANLKVWGNFRVSIRRVSMTYPDIGYSVPRVKSVACLGTRVVRVCLYSRRIGIRIVGFQHRDTPYFSQCWY